MDNMNTATVTATETLEQLLAEHAAIKVRFDCSDASWKAYNED
jgi:hypothetical protein